LIPPPQSVVAPSICLRLTLLGRMIARDGAGRMLTLRSRKTRAILAILALASPRPVLRTTLTELLWSKRDRLQAHGSLRQCIHELQRLLSPLHSDLLQADRSHLTLRREPIWLDTGAVVFCSDLLLEDLGGLDPAFDVWLVAERLRLSRNAAAVAEAAMAVCATPAAIAAAAERLLAIDPTHELAVRALMEAQAELGDRAAAIAAYGSYAAALAERHGGVPSSETQAILNAVRDRQQRQAIAVVPSAVAAVGAASRGRVRVRVAPLRSTDGPDDPLSRGIADEITNELVRFRWLSLLAGPPASAPGREPAHASADPDELNFLIDGTVQRACGRVRVMLRLLDIAAGGEVVWAQRFDPPANDDLRLQEEIAGRVAAQLDPLLIFRSGLRPIGHPASELSAQELVLRAVPAIYRLDQAGFRAAGADLAEAVARAPDYAQAHSWLACWHVFMRGQGWSCDQDALLGSAGELADRATQLDASDARAFSIAGHVQAFLYRQTNAAIGLHERALSLNPNLPLAWALSGLAHSYVGRHDDAIARIRRAGELSPFDPHGFFFDMALMVPHLMRGEFETVVELGLRTRTLNPAFTSTYKASLSALGFLGRREEAAVLAAELLRRDPGFSISRSRQRSPLRQEDELMYAEGLRLAGLPE
jgi:DNA-binding SARP family transcriptional activator